MGETFQKNALFHSRFGGLWTDRVDAAELLAKKRGADLLSEADEVLLRHWLKEGYCVLPGAVPPDVIDACLRDVDTAYAGDLQPLFMEHYVDGIKQTPALKPEHRSIPCKLLDIYSVSDAFRQAMFAPAIVHFLRLIFERPVMAFQSLTFERGTSQAVHQDTAYVRVSSPLEFAASWIALEDIREGSGELEYHAGSHRLPDYPFAGGTSKCMLPPTADRSEYLAYLKDECARRGYAHRRFLAKKGDVLVWSADLAHGGSAVTDRSLTRRSHVVHYCPAGLKPFYFKNLIAEKRVKYGRGLFYSYPKR